MKNSRPLIGERGGCGGDGVAKESDGVDWAAGAGEADDGGGGVDIPDDNGAIRGAAEEKAVIESESENGCTGMRREIESLKGGQFESDDDILFSPKNALLRERQGGGGGDEGADGTAESLVNKVKVTGGASAIGEANVPTKNITIVAGRKKMLARESESTNSVAVAAELKETEAVEKRSDDAIGVTEPNQIATGIAGINSAAHRHSGEFVGRLRHEPRMPRRRIQRIQTGIQRITALRIDRKQK